VALSDGRFPGAEYPLTLAGVFPSQETPVTMGGVRDLAKSAVLARARRLAGESYRLSSRFPPTETYGMTSQLRRAAVSIVANVAEGLGRGTQGDFERFLRIASGSAAEVEVLLDLAVELQLAGIEAVTPLRKEVRILRAQMFRLVQGIAARRAGGA